jgi:hypothetical protein
MRKTPFIIAMNKIDRLYNWRSVANSPVQDALGRQEEYVRKEFEDRLNQARGCGRGCGGGGEVGGGPASGACTKQTGLRLTHTQQAGCFDVGLAR